MDGPTSGNHPVGDPVPPTACSYLRATGAVVLHSGPQVSVTAFVFAQAHSDSRFRGPGMFGRIGQAFSNGKVYGGFSVVIATLGQSNIQVDRNVRSASYSR